MAAPVKEVAWFLLDILPDTITLIRQGRKALQKKKLTRRQRREMILTSFRATQKTKREIPGK
mgnify:CR=1 FL=1